MPYGIGTDYLRYEREVWREEIQRDREEAERRFSPRPGFCPWGCGPADLERNPSWGWRELYPDEEPQPDDIFWQDKWWTPCECNIYSRWRNGQVTYYIGAYPPGYGIDKKDIP